MHQEQCRIRTPHEIAFRIQTPHSTLQISEADPLTSRKTQVYNTMAHSQVQEPLLGSKGFHGSDFQGFGSKCGERFSFISEVYYWRIYIYLRHW
jgi:hypothetical protein